MNQLMCIQFRGLPGSGKTTLSRHLARHFGISVLSKDAIDSILLQDGLTTGSSLTAYHLMMSLADYQLSLGVSIILDAVFPLTEFRQRIARTASQYNARHYVIHTFYSDEALYHERMLNRVQYHAGWTEVERVRQFYEIWSQDDIITIDSVNPVEENLDIILKQIKQG